MDEERAAQPRIQSIELDCPPGSPRPGDLLPGIVEGTGLQIKEPFTKFFGNWTWDYSDVPADEWDKIKPLLKERITSLYEAGLIRYGSW